MKEFEGRLITSDPDLNFRDIAAEMYRVYVYPDGSEVKIVNPIAVAVKAPPAGIVGGGSHRVLDVQGVSNYIPAGWIHLYWTNHEKYPYYQF